MSEVRDVEHIQLTLVDIKQNIRDIKSGTSDFDKRLSSIESEIKSAKTTFKASAIIVSIIFSGVAVIFGAYISKILDALNGIVLK